MKLKIIPVGMLGTNCYLLISQENNCVVIDPGAQPDKIIQMIEKEGLTPKYLLLTHAHYDHVGGAKKILSHFTGLEIYVGAKDADILTNPQNSYAVMRGMGQEEYLFDSVNTVKEGDAFQLDELTIKTLETPGHTMGGVTYTCENLMFSGDTLFRDDVGRTDLYGGDYQVLKHSLKKMCDLDGEYEVYPGHGEATSLNYERAHNRYINE